MPRFKARRSAVSTRKDTAPAPKQRGLIGQMLRKIIKLSVYGKRRVHPPPVIGKDVHMSLFHGMQALPVSGLLQRLKSGFRLAILRINHHEQMVRIVFGQCLKWN